MNVFARSSNNIFTVSSTDNKNAFQTNNQFQNTNRFQATIQKIGTYRDQTYNSTTLPIGINNSNWTTSSIPPTIAVRQNFAQLSLLEIRLQDYYSIRTGNLKAHNKNYIQGAIKEKNISRNIYNSKPKKEPITIKNIFNISSNVGNVFSNQAQNTTNGSNLNNPFSSNTNVFNKTPSNTTNIFANPSNNPPTTNVFNQNNTSAQNIFATTPPSSQMNNPFNTSGSVAMQNNTFNQSQTTGSSTFLNNIFNQNKSSNNTTPQLSTGNNQQTQNIFSNNQQQQSQNNNIFASKTQNNPSTTNIFNTKPSQQNNIFANNNTQNNLKSSTNILNNNNNNIFSTNSNPSNNIFNTNNNNNQNTNIFSNVSNNTSNPLATISNFNPNLLSLASNNSLGMAGNHILIPVPDSIYQEMMRSSTRNDSFFSQLGSQKIEGQKQLVFKYVSPSNLIDDEPNYVYGSWQRQTNDRKNVHNLKTQQFIKRDQKISFKKEKQQSIDIHEARKQYSIRFNKLKELNQCSENIQRNPNISRYFHQNQYSKKGDVNFVIIQTILIDGKHSTTRIVQLDLPTQSMNNNNWKQDILIQIEQQAVKSGVVKSSPEIIVTNQQNLGDRVNMTVQIKSKTINLPGGYWYEPQFISDPSRTKLTIGNKFGEATWINEIDIRDIDFFNSISINRNSLELYQKVLSPPAGTKLNQDCIVKFYSCDLVQKYRERKKQLGYQEIVSKLSAGCKKNGMQFISYDPKKEHWSVKIIPT